MPSNFKWNLHLLSLLLDIYRKIPNISPELIEVRKHFLRGLYSGGAYIRGAYIRGGLYSGFYGILLLQFECLLIIAFFVKFSPSWPKTEKKWKVQKSENMIFLILLKGTTWPNFMFLALSVVFRYFNFCENGHFLT